MGLHTQHYQLIVFLMLQRCLGVQQSPGILRVPQLTAVASLAAARTEQRAVSEGEGSAAISVSHAADCWRETG